MVRIHFVYVLLHSHYECARTHTHTHMHSLNYSLHSPTDPFTLSLTQVTALTVRAPARAFLVV